MKKNSKWYGFIEAGAKSSAVLRDEQLDTGNDKTVYLFNLARNKIIEYRRDIVESKLRELSKDETDLIDALKKAYKIVRKEFEARPKSSLSKLQIVEESSPPKEIINTEIDDEIDLDAEDSDFSDQSLTV
jgi:hypothetical protein